MICKNINTKLCLILGVFFFCSITVGCNQHNESQDVQISNESQDVQNLNEITDTAVKEALYHFKFDYEFVVPGSELSYKYLWDGYDLENKFGPSISKEKRLYTYLTEYKERDSSYYLIYLKKDWIKENEKWMIDYEDNHSNNYLNYHFSSYDNYSIIDGKYYFCYQKLEENKNEDENIRYYMVEKLEDIHYEIDDYQLVFCAESKQAIIKQNISLQKEINKTISLYKRVELIFEDVDEAPKEYFFGGGEKSNQNVVNLLFNYVGERIEAYPSFYEKMVYGSYPILGMQGSYLKKTVRCDVVKEVDRKYFLLPRYIFTSTGNLDLLDDETDLFYYDDVFREHKSDFLNAFVKETNIKNGFYIYALYDYDKVIEIIKTKEKKVL